MLSGFFIHLSVYFQAVPWPTIWCVVVTTSSPITMRTRRCQPWVMSLQLSEEVPFLRHLPHLLPMNSSATDNYRCIFPAGIICHYLRGWRLTSNPLLYTPIYNLCVIFRGNEQLGGVKPYLGITGLLSGGIRNIQGNWKSLFLHYNRRMQAPFLPSQIKINLYWKGQIIYIYLLNNYNIFSFISASWSTRAHITQDLEI